MSDQMSLRLERAAGPIFLVGAALRILVFFIPGHTNSGDSLTRIALTEAWLQNHSSLGTAFGPWLPLHFWMIGVVGLLLKNTMLAGRLLSLVSSIASLFLVWRVAQNLYGSAAASISLLVFSLYSLHIGYSIVPASETTYLLFLLLGLYCFSVYQKSGRLLFLALSGLSMTLASAIRYEAWAILFMMTILAFICPPEHLNSGNSWHSRRLIPLLVFGFSGSLWPIPWLIYSWKQWGHPLYFVSMNHRWVAEQLALGHSSKIYQLGLTPGVILLTLSPLPVLGGLYALSLAARENRGRALAVIFVFSGVVQLYQIISGGVMPYARYTMTLGTLLSIMSGWGLLRLVQKYSPGSISWLLPCVAGTLVLNLAALLVLSETRNTLSNKFVEISPRLRERHYISDTAVYLRSHLSANDSVVIDDYNTDSILLAESAGLPIRSGQRIFLATDVMAPHVLDFIENSRSTFVVYAANGSLKGYLHLPGSCPNERVIADRDFKCVYETTTYQIYRVTPSESEPLPALDTR
jgi:4-amino-4-deoxy-L-arabinose transferase-like glycosyltransferase